MSTTMIDEATTESGRSHDDAAAMAVTALRDAFVARERSLYGETDDGATAPRPPRKTSWAPCVRCGEKNGRVSQSNSSISHTPGRVSGERFGINGQLCLRCYGTLGERVRRGTPAEPLVMSRYQRFGGWHGGIAAIEHEVRQQPLPGMEMGR